MIERFIDTTFGRVFAQTEGDEAASLVLAVHGFSQRNGWHTWQPLMRPLADAGYYVVSVDMPGWGRSTAVAFDPLSPDDGVAVMAELVAGLGREQAAAIMGKSWGGAVAIELALQKPELVQTLILTAPGFGEVDHLGALAQPVLLAWAKDDPTIPYRLAASYETAVPDLELVTYDTGGHSAAPNNAEDFAPRAIAFLHRHLWETNQ